MSLFSFCLIFRFLIVRMPCWPFVEEATLDIFLLRTSTFLGPPPPPKSFLSFGLFLLVWLLYFLCTLEENVVFFSHPTLLHTPSSSASPSTRCRPCSTTCHAFDSSPSLYFYIYMSKEDKDSEKRQQQQRNIFLLQIVCTRLFTALKFLFKKKIFLLRHWSTAAAAAAFCLDSENRVIRFPPTSFHDEIDFFPFLNGAAFKWRISR